MVTGGASSWNLRDQHMMEALDRLVAHHRRHGAPVKAVVWEHNTHIGDARFTDMVDAGMVNVGQLAGERYGEQDVVLVGFGSHSGTVVAAQAWGDETETLLHDAIAEPAALFVFPEQQPDWLRHAADHRAIGVVLHPEAEHWGNDVPSVLGRRYDAFLWFDTTRGLSPLHGVRPSGRELETWPHGR